MRRSSRDERLIGPCPKYCPLIRGRGCIRGVGVYPYTGVCVCMGVGVGVRGLEINTVDIVKG